MYDILKFRKIVRLKYYVKYVRIDLNCLHNASSSHYAYTYGINKDFKRAKKMRALFVCFWKGFISYIYILKIAYNIMSVITQCS